jgi:hypothetical protein
MKIKFVNEIPQWIISNLDTKQFRMENNTDTDTRINSLVHSQIFRE